MAELIGNRQLVAVPSNIPVQTAVIQRTIASTTNTATLAKAITILFPGTYRVGFELRASGAGPIFGQIYRNRRGTSTAVGTLRQVAGAATATAFFEDIGGWDTADTCELQCYATAGAGDGQVRGFRLLAEYDLRPPPIPGGKVTTDTNV